MMDAIEIVLQDILQPGPVIPLALILSLKTGARRANSEHTPIHLEQTKVGGVVNLAISCMFTVSLGINMGKKLTPLPYL
jgi:hypothetical protein